MDLLDKRHSTLSTCSTTTNSDGLSDASSADTPAPAWSDEKAQQRVIMAPLPSTARVEEGQNPRAKSCQCGTRIDVFFIESFVPECGPGASKRMYNFTFKLGDAIFFEFTASFSTMRSCFKPIWANFPSKRIFQDFRWNEWNAEQRGEELADYFNENLNLRSRPEEICSPQVIAAFGISSPKTVSTLMNVAAARRQLLLAEIRKIVVRD